MVTVIDLKGELGKLRTLRGRTPETPEAEREGAFAKLAPYRDGGMFAAKFSGESAWERHPNGDEIVQIVEGATIVHLMTADGPQSVALKAGMVIIVPQKHLAPLRGAGRGQPGDRDAATDRAPDRHNRRPAHPRNDGVSE